MHAQTNISIGANWVNTGLQTEELNSFVTTFNQYHQGTGFVPLKDFKSNLNAPSFNIRFQMLPFKNFLNWDLYFAYSWDKQSNTTTLIQKSKYDFLYRSRNYDFYTEIGYNIQDRIILNAVLGLGVSQEYIEIWKVYTNGDRSITNENDLPGYYTGMAFPMSFGAGVTGKFNNFLIPLKITYAFPVFRSFGNLPFSDGSNVNKYRANNIPIDYHDWVVFPPKNGTENSVGADFRNGLRYQIGVEYIIFSNKNKKKKNEKNNKKKKK